MKIWTAEEIWSDSPTGYVTVLDHQAELDRVMGEAVRVLQAASMVGEIHFRSCALSAHVHDQICAFLSSPEVQAWRERRKEQL